MKTFYYKQVRSNGGREEDCGEDCEGGFVGIFQ